MTNERPAQPRHIAFVASNSGWGGSEVLWSAAAAVLAEQGHRITVLKNHVDREEPRIRRLAELGCRIVDLRKVPLLPRRLGALLIAHFWLTAYALQAFFLWRTLARDRPDLVVVSQGGNMDGHFLAKRTRRLGLPYALVIQKATDLYWPYDDSLAELRSIYRDALACYFVSRHNLRLTEEQLGMALPRGEVVRNPFLVPWDRQDIWPDEKDGFRLACVGRLYPREKGQDLILRVLDRDKWRRRPVSVTFFGSGIHAEALRGMADFLSLKSVVFAGFSHDAASIWRDHHALLLPSRAEGLPLVLVEAMMSGRVPIVTDVAGAAEVVTDGVSGFLAAAPTEDMLDEAMERAWQRRSEWRAIGGVAAADIRKLVPSDPPRAFADLLLARLEPVEPAAAGPSLSEAA